MGRSEKTGPFFRHGFRVLDCDVARKFSWTICPLQSGGQGCRRLSGAGRGAPVFGMADGSNCKVKAAAKARGGKYAL